MVSVNRNLNLEEAKKLFYSAIDDVPFDYYGESAYIYCDAGQVEVGAPDGNDYWYRTWDDMIKAPIFNGKTFPEIVQDIVVYW